MGADSRPATIATAHVTAHEDPQPRFTLKHNPVLSANAGNAPLLHAAYSSTRRAIEPGQRGRQQKVAGNGLFSVYMATGESARAADQRIEGVFCGRQPPLNRFLNGIRGRRVVRRLGDRTRASCPLFSGRRETVSRDDRFSRGRRWSPRREKPYQKPVYCVDRFLRRPPGNRFPTGTGFHEAGGGLKFLKGTSGTGRPKSDS